jgi:apolipoprotein N-acyltransferase
VTFSRGAPPIASAARLVGTGLGIPLVAGAAAVLGFAPVGAWPVPIVSLAVLFAIWTRSASPRQAGLSGYAFGLGYFLAGVSWVYVSLHEFGEMPLVLAALATFCFCAYLALFPALTGWVVARWAPASAARRLTLAPAAFVLAEWLRGTLFTGFPWLTVGTSQVPSSPLAGWAPYGGAYGVSLAAAGSAALLAGFALSLASGRGRLALLAGIAALFAAGAIARLVPWTLPAGPPVSVALLQGNVSQHIKWREDVRTRTLLDYRRMIFEAPARVIVVPETALPAFLDQLPDDYLASLRLHAAQNRQEILLGTVERVFRGEEYDYYNSLVRITGAGNQSYRKRHLVPFGEFIPPGFAWVLTILHIPMTDFARGAHRQAPIEAAGVAFGVAICYEDVYGEEVIDALPAAEALVNVSNDAWFGHSLAPDQHLQASQMRALETGRWMVRATNTGATAAIDETGHVVSRLPEFTVGTLVAEVTPRTGATPYVRWGNGPALMLAFALGLLAAAPRFRRSGSAR